MALSVFTLLYSHQHHPSPELFHFPKLKLCASLPQALKTTNLLSVSINWPLQVPHISGIIQCLPFVIVFPLTFKHTQFSSIKNVKTTKSGSGTVKSLQRLPYFSPALQSQTSWKNDLHFSSPVNSIWLLAPTVSQTAIAKVTSGLHFVKERTMLQSSSRHLLFSLSKAPV